MKNLLTKFTGLGRKKMDDEEAAIETSSQVSLSTQSSENAQQATVDISAADNIRFLDSVLSKKCKKCNSVKPP